VKLTDQLRVQDVGSGLETEQKFRIAQLSQFDKLGFIEN
jgi:hypothetical protein